MLLARPAISPGGRSYSVDINQNQLPIPLQINRMQRSHDACNLLDDIVPLQRIVIPKRWTDSKLRQHANQIISISQLGNPRTSVVDS